jgi:hypothetical protein
VVTKGFETRFKALLHPAPEPPQPPAQNATDARNATAADAGDTVQALQERTLQDDGQTQSATNAAASIQADAPTQNATDMNNSTLPAGVETTLALPQPVIQVEEPSKNAMDTGNATVPGGTDTALAPPKPVIQADKPTQNATNTGNATVTAGAETALTPSEPVIQTDEPTQNATDADNATMLGGEETAQASPEPAVPTGLPPASGSSDRHSVDAPDSGQDQSVTLLFSGDTQGVVYSQPGLSGAVGGIDRRGPVIDHMRTQTPDALLLDAGDAFTSGFPKATRINKTLVRAMNRMGYDVMGLGRHDLAMGEVSLRELVSIAAFPFVCSNLRFHEGLQPWIRDHVILTRNGVRVAVISLLPPDADFRVTGASLLPSAQALNLVLPKLAGRADCVVLLTQMDNAEVAALPGITQSVDAVIGDFRGKSGDNPTYLPPLPKGLGIGMLRLERGERGAFRTADTLPLLTGNDADPDLIRLLEELKN